MEKLFFKIENELITEDNIYHLNDKELYIYSLLKMSKRLDGKIYLSVPLLSDIMELKFSKRDTRNYKILKDVLEELSKKELIKIINTKGELLSVQETSLSTSLCIDMNEIESEGHTQVPYHIFYQMQDMISLYIYIAVKRWENRRTGKLGTFKCSYDRFARILKVTRSTAQKYIEEAIASKLIFRNTGDFIDDENEIKQEVNEYRCTPFSESEKSVTTKVREYNSQFSPDSVLSECDYDNSDLQHFFEMWDTFEDRDMSTGGTKPYVPDSTAQLMYMEILENTKNRKPTKMEKKFIDKAEWRIKAIYNSDSHFLIEEYENEKREAEDMSIKGEI